MDIPKSFKLFGHTVEVRWEPLLATREGLAGRFDIKDLKINLQPNTDADPKARTWIEQTYFHEVVHAILEHTGRHDLSEDEKFVDVFASCLHQILTTSTGKLV